MELADSKTESTRSVLRIDLNEIPSTSSSGTPSPDAFSFVRAFHARQTSLAGTPAEVPGVSDFSACTACGQPEFGRQVVVCDGCERVFHVGCVGLQHCEAAKLEEWMCRDCVSNGVRSGRWTLGLKSLGKDHAGVRLVDINSLPPNDDQGEATEKLLELRSHIPGDNSFGGKPFGAPVTYSNINVGNGIGSQKASGVVTHAIQSSLEDIFQHAQTAGKSLKQVDMRTLLETFGSNNHTFIRLATQNTSEMYLQALREFISERHGVLGEGWHVEFKTYMGSGEQQAVYRAPDGKTFESLAEVASYLGLMPSTAVESEVRSNGSMSLQRRYLPKMRKSAGLAIPNGAAESNETSMSGCEVLSSQFHNKDCVHKPGNSVEVMDVMPKGNSDDGPQQLDDGFPVQFEDFFILSLGKIDTRASYHNVNQICPIGYRSCWHDKITGSIFTCSVLDGGNSGPVFKVRRRSCSAVPMPDASTVLLRSNIAQSDCRNKRKKDMFIPVNMDYDEDWSVEMILSDPSPPMEYGILSCLGSFSDEPSKVHMSNNSQFKASTFCELFGNFSSDTSVFTDEIGEFSVEEFSSSLAWRMMSEKLVNIYRELYMQRGTIKLFCRHIESGTSADWDVTDERNKEKFISLTKFCGSSSIVDILPIIQGNYMHETVLEAIFKWLDQDRFGLDVEFVQEIVEKLPGVGACSQYAFLKDRGDYTSSLTVGNGFLVMKPKDKLQAIDKEAVDVLSRSCKGNETLMVEDPSLLGNLQFPPGNPISSKLPPQLVGDVLQAWEFLLRFHENLDLRQHFSFEDLEEELINPWADGFNLLEQFRGEFDESQNTTSQRTDSTSEHILSSSIESSSAVPVENPHTFIQIETGAMKEAALAEKASATYRRCTGFILTEVHISLLKVLISELQSKVAAVVDPNFDFGESRSKRGKRKDTDCSIAGKRTRLNMLPINGLTWPELAHRYILVALSMDGCFDSAEITIRENDKVFRCLQGDGGVLCGSITGVAGMEADAVLLADATKKIFNSLSRDNDILTIDEGGSNIAGAHERSMATDDIIPEWAQLLVPVRKLPTNVGARIRKCIYEALEKGPPEWAKKILEHSISKEVYKGNASGPTKRAVLSVLADVCAEGSRQKPDRKGTRKILISISDVIMKQCRIVLRRVAAADDTKVFCNLLGKKLLNSGDNDDEGILGYPAMVSRPLDFRTIDLRLAAGVYGGSHEAFLEDVHELWTNIRIAYRSQPDLVQFAETLIHKFETLYEKEVVSIFRRFKEFAKFECLDVESLREVNDLLVSTNELPKAPWEEGICKICGIDKDDDSVLLCDTCDAEYHTYCLNPPLTRIPTGNWYCPSCAASKHMVEEVSACTWNICPQKKKVQGEFRAVLLDALTHLAAVMAEREYWELDVEERIFLLNFLCNELLNSSHIRQHLEQCAKLSVDLQQKLRSISIEWKSLKNKEEVKATKGNGPNAPNLFPSTNNLGKGVSVDSRIVETVNAKDQHKDVQVVADVIPENTYAHTASLDNPCGPKELPQVCLPLESGGTNVDEHVRPMLGNDSQDDGIELNSVCSEISILQDSITSTEKQLLKLAMRGEFLGTDSAGRLYWVLSNLDRHPWVIVSGTVPSQYEKKLAHRNPVESLSVFRTSASYGIDAFSTPGGSGVPHPFMHELDHANSTLPPWVSYQSDAEIKELVGYLKDNDSRERELKESILQWQKLKFQASLQTGKQEQERSINCEIPASPECLFTRAGNLLETKYGPCFEPEAADFLKKRGRKAKLSTEEKMCRCECLELVWPSRHHCLSCHRTFLSDMEFEGHGNCECSLGPPACDKSKENSAFKGKGIMKSEPALGGSVGDMNIFEGSKNGCSELNSRLIKYQNDGLVCPFDYEDICTKFVMKNSNKEVAHGIGLLGSNGIPSFVPSLSPYLNDPALMLTPRHRDGAAPDELVLHQGTKITIDEGQDSVCDNPPIIYAANASSETFRTEKSAFKSLEQKDKEMPSCSHVSAVEFSNCCIISESSLRPLTGKSSQILRRLKINLLDMDAALPEAALRPSRTRFERRWAWRAFVKSAETIYEMVQAVIVFEDMIKMEYLGNMWWYWSSLSAAARTSTLSSLALRIYSLDAAIVYEDKSSNYPLQPSGKPDHNPQLGSDATEKSRLSRRVNKKRKEPE